MDDFNQWLVMHRPSYNDVFFILNLGYVSQYISSNDTRCSVFNMQEEVLSEPQLFMIYNDISANVIKYGKSTSKYAIYFDEMLFILLYLGLFFDNKFYDETYKIKFYNHFYVSFIESKPYAFKQVLTDIRFHLM